MSQAQGMGWSLPSRSFPVKTATTPGSALALLVLTRVILACPYGLRRIAMYVMPGNLTSSVKAPLPVIRRGSSRRLMELPKSRDTAMMVSPLLRLVAHCNRTHGCGLHLLGGGAHGADDILVAGAAAEVALKLL